MDRKTKEPGGRRKYFSDYPFQDVKTKSGKTKRRRQYKGKHFAYVVPREYPGTADQFRARIKWFYGGITLAMLVLWVCASFIRTAASLENTVYVIAPFVVGAIPIFLILFTICEFVFTKKHIYERVFADSMTKGLRTKTVFAMICGGLCALPEIVYLIIKTVNGQVKNWQVSVQTYEMLGISSASLWNDISYIILTVGISALAYFFLKLQDSLKMEEVG